jgi:hypothetical protein
MLISKNFLTREASYKSVVILEPQQHSEHSFELAVEMDLVASKPLQLVRIERLTQHLLADQRTIGQFLLPVLEPRQHRAFEEAGRFSTSAAAGSSRSPSSSGSQASVSSRKRLFLVSPRIRTRECRLRRSRLVVVRRATVAP